MSIKATSAANYAAKKQQSQKAEPIKPNDPEVKQEESPECKEEKAPEAKQEESPEAKEEKAPEAKQEESPEENPLHARAREVFATHEKANEVFFTSEGTCFIQELHAVMHAQNLVNATITPVKRSEVE